MNRKQIVLLPLLGVALLAAVTLIPRVTTFLTEPPGGERIVVVLKTVGPDMEFWQIVRAGIQEAATELNVEPAIVGPRWERDVDGQIEILRNVIARSPEAILLAASDFNRLVPLAEEAAAKGVTIVTLDSALNSDVPVSFVATDNVAAGRKAGAEVARLLPPGRAVAIVSHIPGVATAIDREHGVRRALSEAGVREIPGTFYSDNDPARAYRITLELLETYPDLGGVVALNESSTVGVGRALRDEERYDEVILVGFDNSREEIRFLEQGVVRALVVQRPFNMGYLGIQAVVDALRGGDVEPVIHTGSVLVRREEIFTEENQRLLFPVIDRESPR